MVMNNHKCPEELVAAIERSRVLESLTPAQAAAFDDVIAEKNRQIERAYDGLNYQDRQITELRARVAELEAERAELMKDRERLDWLNGQREDLVAQGEHLQVELHGHGWGIYGQCDTVRQAIDAAREEE